MQQRHHLICTLKFLYQIEDKSEVWVLTSDLQNQFAFRILKWQVIVTKVNIQSATFASLSFIYCDPNDHAASKKANSHSIA